MSRVNHVHEHKRRILYINKAFQRNFIIKFCLLATVGSIITMALVYWFAMNSTTVAIHQGRVGVHTTAEYLLPLMIQTLSLQCIVGVIATIGLTLIISHQIAGPLYRFKNMFQLLSEGDLRTHMHLRDHDQLKDLAQSYNEAIIKLNVKINGLKKITSLNELKIELDKFKTI